MKLEPLLAHASDGALAVAMRARGGERSFGTWLSGLVGSASASSGGGGTDEPRTAVCDDEIDDRWATSAAARAQQNRTELYGLSAFAYQSQYVG